MAIPTHIHNASLTQWAAAFALLNQGFSQQTILTILNIELPVWYKASLAWNEALQTNQAIAEKYGSIYCQPFVGNFAQLQPKTRKHFNLNTYYNIF